MRLAFRKLACYRLRKRSLDGLEFQAKQFRVKRGERELAVNLLPLSPQVETDRVDPAIVADHLPPSNPNSLVQRPVKLESKDGEPVLSWTIATRDVIAPDGIIPALTPEDLDSELLETIEPLLVDDRLPDDGDDAILKR